MGANYNKLHKANELKQEGSYLGAFPQRYLRENAEKTLQQ